jgi:hypothetical protein
MRIAELRFDGFNLGIDSGGSRMRVCMDLSRFPMLPRRLRKQAVSLLTRLHGRRPGELRPCGGVLYRKPKAAKEADLELMRLIDRLHLENLFTEHGRLRLY